MLKGRVQRKRCIIEHEEKVTSNLAGKEVAIMPETAVNIKNLGIRVDVLPINLVNKEPTPIMACFIDMDKRTRKQLVQAVKNAG